MSSVGDMSLEERSKTVGKVMMGLILGLVIGIGCRCFDIPLPSPPQLVGALVILSMTSGYVGTDYLLNRQAKMREERHEAAGKNHDVSVYRHRG